MLKFTPIVITSRKAKKEIEKIKAHHADILRGMDEHKKKVDSFKLQKESERQQAIQQAVESRKQRMAEEAQAKKEQAAQEKERMAHQAKMAELELKRQALNG